MMEKAVRLVTWSLLVSYSMLITACGAHHGIAPAMRTMDHEGPSSRVCIHVPEDRSQGYQQLGAFPLVLVPVGIGLKEILIGGGAIVLGGILIDFCIRSGACAAKSTPKDESDASVNKPPPRSPPDERCKKVAENCRAQCQEELPTPDFGFAFWNCINACLTKSGCSPGMY
ncbi:MAG TPA: hypothetical protein VEU33_47025 [Archangium sp.]|nr:hypothetical protein [Archangium sp.]